MAEMTDNEVLSVLNRMDAEQRTMESLQSARKHVREVIERYQTISAALPSLEAAYAEHQKARHDLEQETAQMKAALEAQLAQKREETSAEVASCQARIDTAQAKAVAAEQDAQDKEAFAAKRGEQLDAEIRAKVEQLAAAETALTEFKRQHGLG